MSTLRDIQAVQVTRTEGDMSPSTTGRVVSDLRLARRVAF
jgi:hypothetical protein